MMRLIVLRNGMFICKNLFISSRFIIVDYAAIYVQYNQLHRLHCVVVMASGEVKVLFINFLVSFKIN